MTEMSIEKWLDVIRIYSAADQLPAGAGKKVLLCGDLIRKPRAQRDTQRQPAFVAEALIRGLVVRACQGGGATPTAR
jgi:hypothetical protein